MKSKTLTLSLVIPVYNEENHLKACLDAIAAQSTKPYEVIIVDNNSTDKSMAIAEKYNFVEVVHESRQGRGYARTKGFNSAKGDIIGRIDADSVIMPDWVARALDNFKDPLTAGLTGLARTHTIPLRLVPNFHSTLWSRAYFWSTFSDIRMHTMWGANMALRRSAWLSIRSQACLDDEVVHEDIDISLLMQAAGQKIVQDNRLLITTKGTSYNYFPKMVHYFRLRFSTRRFRKDLLYSVKPPVNQFGFWRVQFYRFISFVPGIFFVGSSILLWPLDTYMIQIRKRVHWLD